MSARYFCHYSRTQQSYLFRMALVWSKIAKKWWRYEDF
jgi:hypothetical protein